MKKQIFEITVKDLETNNIVDKIETNCALFCANVKPEAKGEVKLYSSLYAFHNVRGEKINAVLDCAIENANVYKTKLFIENLDALRVNAPKNNEEV